MGLGVRVAKSGGIKSVLTMACVEMGKGEVRMLSGDEKVGRGIFTGKAASIRCGDEGRRLVPETDGGKSGPSLPRAVAVSRSIQAY